MVNGERLILVLVTLFVFGLGYNLLVGRFEHEGRSQGYVALLVAFGVGVTLIGSALIVGWWAVLWTFLAFVASGFPMIAGSVWRHTQERRKDEQLAHDLAVDALEKRDVEA